MEMDEVTRHEGGIPVQPSPGNPLLLQLRPDRRLGHEWDDWDGGPLPDGGVFRERPIVFFGLATVAALGVALASSVGIWLLIPRLNVLWSPLGQLLLGVLWTATALWLVWLGMVAVVFRTGRNWLPPALAEGGLLPWVMPRLERIGTRLGLSRDRVGNAMLRVFNRLSAARSKVAIDPEDLLILLPRCLGKEAMQLAMGISSRYGVPLFVASRGRYAREMIARTRPHAIVAVACERDLVSGVHDVGGRLPVLGSTLALRDGPCRNTTFDPGELEGQIRRMLGLDEKKAVTSG